MAVWSFCPPFVCVLQHPDSKMMQINLTGFLNGKNAREFMKDLWPLLLSAQDNIAGIPSAFLEQKKEEIKQRQIEQEKLASLKKVDEDKKEKDKDARERAQSKSPRRRKSRSPSPRRRSPVKRDRKRSPSRSPRRKSSPVGGSSPPPPLMQLPQKPLEQHTDPDTSGRTMPEPVIQEASSTCDTVVEVVKADSVTEVKEPSPEKTHKKEERPRSREKEKDSRRERPHHRSLSHSRSRRRRSRSRSYSPRRRQSPRRRMSPRRRSPPRRGPTSSRHRHRRSPVRRRRSRSASSSGSSSSGSRSPKKAMKRISSTPPRRQVHHLDNSISPVGRDRRSQSPRTRRNRSSTSPPRSSGLKRKQGGRSDSPADNVKPRPSEGSDSAAAAAGCTEVQKRRAAHFLPGTMERDSSTEDSLIMEHSSEPTEHDSVTSDSDTDIGDEDGEYLPGAGSSSTSSTESSEGDEGEMLPDLSWTSKNRKIHWEPTNSKRLQFKPPGTGLTPGPTCYAVARVGELIDSFDLFLTTKITKLVTEYTNLYGRRMVPKWKDLDATTVRAYFGLLLLAGVYRSRGEATRSLWDNQAGRHIFRATMSVKTFETISRTLRFDDPLSRPWRRRADKLAAIREIWDLWTAQLPLMFNPDVEICVDEQLVPYRGRCEFRQYMPKKPAKYGLKMWVTCDVQTAYAWKVSLYTGRLAGAPAEQNQGRRVVLDMTEGLKGVNVTCDNFFSSFGLAEELLRRKNTMVGTMRKNLSELPPQLLRVYGREALSSIFAFTPTHTLVSYVPKQRKNVILLSTKHSVAEISSGEKRKPQIILDYNRCKGGVDTMDEMIATYSCRRRTRRWPLALFFNLLDISALNSYIVWMAINPEWHQGKSHKRRLFLEELGKKLITPHMARRPRPQIPEAASLVLQAQAGFNNPTTHANPTSAATTTTPSRIPTARVRKQCAVCPTRRIVCCTCTQCGKHVCKEHYYTICTSCLP
ncbi:serine/arginine repetitive matrix protein 1 isoform X2 [Mastacembelus armatus]|uniref:serine/arginine repetitive matrix protein 1 isoform X2 n=1 Tax=Mastacembelus armatus TaxID=205130 RepID=UPI000E45B824|nr:serine/arginine repetitive matrix protein 1 isoform X2 [Mastacembelus armatus]